MDAEATQERAWWRQIPGLARLSPADAANRRMRPLWDHFRQ